MENIIRHEGIIKSVSQGHVQVRILQASACASCKVASRCHTAEAKEKVVDVYTTVDEGRWHVGQQVVVSTQGSMAGKALLLGFGLPLVLMLALLVTGLAGRWSEGLIALLMLASLVPYYALLWLFRKRIAAEIAFQIE